MQNNKASRRACFIHSFIHWQACVLQRCFLLTAQQQCQEISDRISRWSRSPARGQTDSCILPHLAQYTSSLTVKQYILICTNACLSPRSMKLVVAYRMSGSSSSFTDTRLQPARGAYKNKPLLHTIHIREGEKYITINENITWISRSSWLIQRRVIALLRTDSTVRTAANGFKTGTSAGPALTSSASPSWREYTPLQSLYLLNTCPGTDGHDTFYDGI